MKKTLLVSSIALTSGVIAPSANAAFTPLSAGNYTMSISGGCYNAGENCQASNNQTYVDNTISEATTTVENDTITTRAIGSAIGSGIAGDGLMGVINFAVDASGNMTINSFNQDSYLRIGAGDFYIDASGTAGTGAMTGNIGTNGAMTFTPTGREAMWSFAATTIGIQEFNRDVQSGLYDTFTTGTSTNRDKGSSPAFTMTGTALTDDGVGGWTGTLVSAWNFNGDKWLGFRDVQFSELWDISITASTVPIPAAAWLFGSGLLGLIGVAQHRKKRV